MSADDMEAYMAEVFKAQVVDVATHIQAFVPSLTEAQRMKLGEIVANEQLEIAAQIFPTLVDEKLVEKYPTFVLMIKNLKTGLEGKIQFPKRIADCGGDPQLALINALTLAFTVSPLARALLQAHGFAYNFAQAPGKVEPPNQRKIII